MVVGFGQLFHDSIKQSSIEHCSLENSCGLGLGLLLTSLCVFKMFMFVCCVLCFICRVFTVNIFNVCLLCI
jgi:hypothetical protein